MSSATIARSLAVLALAATGIAFGNGCGAAPEDAAEEHDGSQAAALKGVGTPPVTPPYMCSISSTPLEANTFENILSSLGCASKHRYTSSGGTDYAWWETSCPTTTTTSFVCPSRGLTLNHNGDLVPTIITGNAQQAADCYKNTAPYNSSWETDYAPCTVDGANPNHTLYLFWDPLCTGTVCNLTPPHTGGGN